MMDAVRQLRPDGACLHVSVSTLTPEMVAIRIFEKDPLKRSEYVLIKQQHR